MDKFSLNEIEKQIMRDIFDMVVNHKAEIRQGNYSLNETDNELATYEFASYLIKLKAVGLIDFEESNVFSAGGKKNKQYGNNVRIIFPSSIRITDPSREHVLVLRMTGFEKFKNFINKMETWQKAFWLIMAACAIISLIIA